MTKQARTASAPRRVGLCVRSSDGVALLITVLILFVVSLLGATVIRLGDVDFTLSGNYRSSTTSFHLAESGLQAAAADLRTDYNTDPGDNWLVDWVDMSGGTPVIYDPFPDPTATTIGGLALSPASPASNPYPGTPYAIGGPQNLGGGSYTRMVWLPPTVDSSGGNASVNLRIRSVGSDPSTATPAESTVDGVVRAEIIPASPYSTAMFFGSGSNGQDVVKGNNLRIAGSVLVTGDGNTKFQLQGRSKVVNNYAGIDDPATGLGALALKLPGLDPVDYNGENVQTLETVLRIKDANLQITGRASAGDPDTPGDGYKETLDAIYSDDPPGQNDEVYADVVGAYDLDASVAFPSLDAPYVAPNGSAYSSFQAYLNSIAYAPPLGGDLTIDEDTSSFVYNDPSGKGSIAWDADAETLTIDGVIKVDGQIKLGDEEVSAVQYAGTGVLWATDKIEILADVYPAGQYLGDGPDADALVDGNLGLVARSEIAIDADDSSMSRIVATLFSEEKISVNNAANIAGSVVTGFFDANNNDLVQIWHTPALSQLAPFGLPTTQNLSTIEMSIVDWFQRR